MEERQKSQGKLKRKRLAGKAADNHIAAWKVRPKESRLPIRKRPCTQKNFGVNYQYNS